MRNAFDPEDSRFLFSIFFFPNQLTGFAISVFGAKNQGTNYIILDGERFRSLFLLFGSVCMPILQLGILGQRKRNRTSFDKKKEIFFRSLGSPG